MINVITTPRKDPEPEYYANVFYERRGLYSIIMDHTKGGLTAHIQVSLHCKIPTSQLLMSTAIFLYFMVQKLRS